MFTNSGHLIAIHFESSDGMCQKKVGPGKCHAQFQKNFCPKTLTEQEGMNICCDAVKKAVAAKNHCNFFRIGNKYFAFIVLSGL